MPNETYAVQTYAQSMKGSVGFKRFKSSIQKA